MYKLNQARRPTLNGRFVKEEVLPTSKKFTTPAGPCVVVAKNLEEKVALANAEKPEDIEGFEEAFKLAQG